MLRLATLAAGMNTATRGIHTVDPLRRSTSPIVGCEALTNTDRANDDSAHTDTAR